MHLQRCRTPIRRRRRKRRWGGREWGDAALRGRPRWRRPRSWYGSFDSWRVWKLCWFLLYLELLYLEPRIVTSESFLYFYFFIRLRERRMTTTSSARRTRRGWSSGGGGWGILGRWVARYQHSSNYSTRFTSIEVIISSPGFWNSRSFQQKRGEAAPAAESTGKQHVLVDASLNVSDAVLMESSLEIDESLFNDAVSSLHFQFQVDCFFSSISVDCRNWMVWVIWKRKTRQYGEIILLFFSFVILSMLMVNNWNPTYFLIRFPRLNPLKYLFASRISLGMRDDVFLDHCWWVPIHITRKKELQIFKWVTWTNTSIWVPALDQVEVRFRMATFLYAEFSVIWYS